MATRRKGKSKSYKADVAKSFEYAALLGLSPTQQAHAVSGERIRRLSQIPGLKSRLGRNMSMDQMQRLKNLRYIWNTLRKIYGPYDRMVHLGTPLITFAGDSLRDVLISGSVSDMNRVVSHTRNLKGLFKTK